MLSIDSHEPAEAESLIGPLAKRDVLNERGWADYMWSAVDGMVHVERKTWAELLPAVDKVEDQIRRHMTNQPKARLLFVLEGLVWPVSVGTAQLKSTNRDRLWAVGHTSSVRLGQIYSWLYQIQKFIEVYQTPNYLATCQCLVSIYKADQKEDHRTLQRYYKTLGFHPNPQVATLMNVSSNIGEARAKALIDKYTTVWEVIHQSPQELATVDGIGVKLATNILRRLGRLDI